MSHLAPVFETVTRLRAELPGETTLLGFCGAPWTVASYMIGGRGTPDLAPARALAEGDTALVDTLIDRLVAVQTEYLVRQLEAGADAVQIFESHAGTLPLAVPAPGGTVEPVGDVAESALRVRASAPGCRGPRSSCSPAARASTATPGWCRRPAPTPSASTGAWI